MADKPIRLMIIDESLFFREFMSRSLSADPSIEVVAACSDPAAAAQKIPGLQPNIITLDIEGRGGQYKESVMRFRQDYPAIPIIILNAQGGGVFEALKMGAVDFVAKPGTQAQADNSAFIREAANKIKTVYSTSSPAVYRPAVPKPVAGPEAMQAAQPVTPPRPAPSSPAPAKPPAAESPKMTVPFIRPLPGASWNFPDAQKRIIAIGASTGGTEATLTVVKDLPANTPGIVIVQHMPPVFTKMYAERLDHVCSMTVKEAENGDRVRQGLILLAPGGDRQMRLAQDARGYFVKLEQGAKVSGHCPSVDALFESVARVAGANAVGVILTGMGGDGAVNLLKMRKAGAYTIGQDEASCVVYGMPMVAYNLGAVVDQLPLDAIGGALLRYLTK